MGGMFKKGLIAALALIMVFALAACGVQPAVEESSAAAAVEPAENTLIRLSTTTSVNDSGLLPYLLPAFEADTGYTVEVSSAGSGAAIEMAANGDADALLVHSKAAEEEFIGEGYATERIPFMYNYFVIIGPADDPAGVADAASATEAFQAIAEGGYPFISRGDDSGTHKAELKIWDAAGIVPNPETDEWYVSAGDGMGAVINMAAEKQAYTLTDKATYLAHEQKDKLNLLMEESPEMKNTYSMLVVAPEKWPETNFDGSNAWVEWMLSDKAAQLINAFGVAEYGEPLFFTQDPSTGESTAPAAGAAAAGEQAA